MPRVVLGVDPGLRHTGWAVLVDGKVKARGTIVPPGDTKQPVADYLNTILPELKLILLEWTPIIAAVEQVGWYGKGKKIILPLSHVAGAITGMVTSFGVPVYLLYANMKKGRVRTSKSWTEHEKDAALLASAVDGYEKAREAGDEAFLHKKSAFLKHYVKVP